MGWTERQSDKLTNEDLDVIKAAANIVGVAQLWATGEQHTQTMGGKYAQLLDINEHLAEPLFMLTARNHIKMIRYDFTKVMGQLSHYQRQDTLIENMKRLNYEFTDPTMTDFYESMINAIEANRPKKEAAFLYFTEDKTGYLSCSVSSMLLFHKQGYLDVGAAELFANLGKTMPDFSKARYQILTKDELGLLATAQEGGKGKIHLTNQELMTLQQLWSGVKSGHNPNSVVKDGKEKKEAEPSNLCIDCGKPFTLTPGERQYYWARGWELPKRCKDCRESKTIKEVQHNSTTTSAIENSTRYGGLKIIK
ncbi:hypothetical protein FACS189445_6070 [Spirochaetia bacterium]|nr:hypothetical protein FACS189445_6070 [Spirochaetia bacterium]